MSTRLLRLSSGLVLALAGCGAPLPVPSVRNDGPAFNQLKVSGNACGPAALLNAFRFGNKSWQGSLDSIPGESDKDKLTTVLGTSGAKPSSQLANRTRWSKAGINVPDLSAMANDLTSGHSLPPVRGEILQLESGETPPHLLARCHSLLERSLREGFPPVICVRRHVLRVSPGGASAWITVDSHFITLTRLAGATGETLAFDYIDPWGGRRGTGTFKVSTVAGLGLTADLPVSPVGRRLVHSGETSEVTLSAAVAAGG